MQSVTVKEFLKSVEIWPSYRYEFGVPLFGTRCICVPEGGRSNTRATNECCKTHRAI